MVNFCARCPEGECGLGFSTKQCLQVHLRKAHGFSEENMPQVQRTIPYTFDAYSGGVIKDPGRGKLPDFATGSSGRLSQLGEHQVNSLIIVSFLLSRRFFWVAF